MTSEAQEGHRQRLREKFLKSGLSAFHDYEIVEMLLTLGSPRRDCKQQAKEAIKRFKTLRGVLEAPAEELQEIMGIGPQSVFSLKLVQEVAREFLKEKILDQPIYTSAKQVFDYLYHSMRDLKKESFKVIYLNGQNQIIETETLIEGSVGSAVVEPRELMESALKHRATSLVLAHNHPSGNPLPSDSDREITRDLVYAGNIMRIKVLDHIIIGNDRYYSFSGEGLIAEYESSFLSLKIKGVAEARKHIYHREVFGGAGE